MPQSSNEKTERSQDVRIGRASLVSALKDLEIMLQSLHRVGSFYADDQNKCDEETIRLIDGFSYSRRLSRVRSILLGVARRDYTEAEYELLEEELGRVKHWRPPKRITTT